MQKENLSFTNKSCFLLSGRRDGGLVPHSVFPGGHLEGARSSMPLSPAAC